MLSSSVRRYEENELFPSGTPVRSNPLSQHTNFPSSISQVIDTKHGNYPSNDSNHVLLRQPVPNMISASNPIKNPRDSLGYPTGLFTYVTPDDEEKLNSQVVHSNSELFTPLSGRKRGRSSSISQNNQIQSQESELNRRGWVMSALAKLPIVGSLVSPKSTPQDLKKEPIRNIGTVSKGFGDFIPSKDRREQDISSLSAHQIHNRRTEYYGFNVSENYSSSSQRGSNCNTNNLSTHQINERSTNSHYDRNDFENNTNNQTLYEKKDPHLLLPSSISTHISSNMGQQVTPFIFGTRKDTSVPSVGSHHRHHPIKSSRIQPNKPNLEGLSPKDHQRLMKELPKYSNIADEQRDLEYIMQIRQKYGLTPAGVSSPNRAATGLSTKRMRTNMTWDPFTTLTPTIYNPLDHRCHTQTHEPSLNNSVISCSTGSRYSNPFATNTSAPIVGRLKKKRGLQATDYRRLLRQAKFHPCKWIDYFDYVKAKDADQADQQFFSTAGVKTSTLIPSTNKLVETQPSSPTISNLKQVGLKEDTISSISERSRISENKSNSLKSKGIPSTSTSLSVSQVLKHDSLKTSVSTSSLSTPKQSSDNLTEHKTPLQVSSITVNTVTVREETENKKGLKSTTSSSATPTPWWLAKVDAPVEVSIEGEGVFADNAEDEDQTELVSTPSVFPNVSTLQHNQLSLSPQKPLPDYSKSSTTVLPAFEFGLSTPQDKKSVKTSSLTDQSITSKSSSVLQSSLSSNKASHNTQQSHTLSFDTKTSTQEDKKPSLFSSTINNSDTLTVSGGGGGGTSPFLFGRSSGPDTVQSSNTLWNYSGSESIGLNTSSTSFSTNTTIPTQNSTTPLFGTPGASATLTGFGNPSTSLFGEAGCAKHVIGGSIFGGLNPSTNTGLTPDLSQPQTNTTHLTETNNIAPSSPTLSSSGLFGSNNTPSNNLFTASSTTTTSNLFQTDIASSSSSNSMSSTGPLFGTLTKPPTGDHSPSIYGTSTTVLPTQSLFGSRESEQIVSSTVPSGTFTFGATKSAEPSSTTPFLTTSNSGSLFGGSTTLSNTGTFSTHATTTTPTTSSIFGDGTPSLFGGSERQTMIGRQTGDSSGMLFNHPSVTATTTAAAAPLTPSNNSLFSNMNMTASSTFAGSDSSVQTQTQPVTSIFGGTTSSFFGGSSQPSTQPSVTANSFNFGATPPSQESTGHPTISNPFAANASRFSGGGPRRPKLRLKRTINLDPA